MSCRSTVEKVILQLSQQTLAGAFHAWVAFSSERQDWRQAAEVVRSRLRQYLLRATLRHWHGMAEMKRKMQGAVRRLVHNNLWQIFHTWQVSLNPKA